MGTFISHNPIETEALGEEWGRTVENGLVLALSGELGAGKTQLVKGLARGLGITARVHSPTFSLINIYSGGRMELFHLDLYRLDSPEQAASAGLEQYLNPEGIAVIEWAERMIAAPASKSDFKAQPLQAVKLRWVRIETLGETERRIDYEDFGA